MLIKGGVSPRTSSRVDTPQQNPSRPCRPPAPEEFLTFEDDVVFEWSKSIPPDVGERRSSRSRAGDRSKSAGSHLPGLFSEVIGESLSQRSASSSLMHSPTITSIMLTPTSSLMTASTSSRDHDGNASDISGRSMSRSGSANIDIRVRPASPYRCQTAPPISKIIDDIDVDLDAMNMVDVVTEHELRSRERSKSCRLYGNQSRSLQENTQQSVRSARKVRRPNEERYLQHKFRERPCSRAESFVNEDMFESTTDLSRECCDVLGPRHCYDCARITQRDDSVYRNKSAFPSIHMTPKNISTITLVQRLFPELTTLDILEGVADGYISSRSFSQDRLLEIVERKKVEARKKEVKEKWKGAAKKHISISAFSVPDKVHFFSNFTDLRAQILAQRGSYTGFKGTLFPAAGLQQMPPPTEVELVLRKEEDRENPANYFCPPIMTREEILRQKTQPRFYAGSTQEYKLPDAPNMDSQSVVPKPSKGPKPGSPRVDGGGPKAPQGKPPLALSSGGSGGIFGKTPASRAQGPSKLGRPALGGGFARKSMAKSSFSRPLQMETLTEDGSQSERDVEEEEEEKEEEEEVVVRVAAKSSKQRQLVRSTSYRNLGVSSPLLLEKKDEEEKETGDIAEDREELTDDEEEEDEEEVEEDMMMEEETEEEHLVETGAGPGDEFRGRIAQSGAFQAVLEEEEEEEEEEEDDEVDDIEYQDVSDSGSDLEQ